MKILHLIDSGGLYGAEQMLLALTEEQVKQGLEPIILSCGLPEESDKPIEIEAEKRNVSIIKWRMKTGLNFKGAWQIIKLAKKERIDIIHSHGYKFNILFAIFPKKIRKIPVISTVHGYVIAEKYSKMWINQILDKLALRYLDFVILVSPSLINLSCFSSISREKIDIVFNGISKDSLATKRTINHSSQIKILAVGRLAPEKGFEILIDCIHELVKKYDVYLTIMGDGKDRKLLTKKIERLQLENRITLLGFINEPSKMYSKFDLLVMPSLTEGMPITILESMRDRLPILASNVGGIPVILGTDSSLLFQPNDMKALLTKVEEFIHYEKEKVNSICYSNKLLFNSQFTSTHMANNYKNIYEKIC